MTMKGMVLTGFGGTEKLSWRTDLPVPKPAADEVLVRLRTTAVNNTEIAFRRGWYKSAEGDADPLTVFPFIQGAGGAGSIEAVGSAVADLSPGDVVVVDPFIRKPGVPLDSSMMDLLGTNRDGCFAEYVVVPQENAVPVRGSVSFKKLACLPTAYQTAEEMQLRAGVSAGQRVLVTGASGGVGAANVELAKMRGATVIAVTSRSKQRRIEQLGADVVILREDLTPDAELPKSLEIDTVLDVIGGPNTQRWLSHLVPGGALVTAGAIDGPIVSIDLRTVIYQSIRLLGQGVARPDALVNLIDYVETGKLDPCIDSSYALFDLKSAQEEFEAKKYVGKIIVDIDAQS